MALTWPLQNTFCFPLYYYPVFITVGWIIFYTILRILSCFQTVRKDSKKSKKFLAKQKEQTIQHLSNLTPLPIDIVNVIVNHFLFDEDDKNIFWKMLNNKLQFKSKIVLKFMLIYAICGVLLYTLCFIIIIIEFIQWRQQNIDTLSSWQLFQGWLVSILFVHPFWKMINWTTSIFTIFDGYNIESFASAIKIESWFFYCFVGIPYTLILVGYMIPAFFTMILPAMILFIFVPCCYCCYLFAFALLQDHPIFEKLFEDTLEKRPNEDYTSVWQREEMLLMCFYGGVGIVGFYVAMCIIVPAVWHMYNQKGWLDGFVYGISSGYCPEFVVDFSDWKSVVLFVTWIGF